MGCVVTFVLGGVVFLWAFGSAEMRTNAVYVTVLVAMVVVVRLARLLWVIFLVRRELARPIPDDTPRRAPRQWVAVDWPSEEDPKRARGVNADATRPVIDWPDEDERRY